MLTRSAPHDANAGLEKERLLDLEGQLAVARRQLAVLKQTARGLAKMRKVCDGSICSQNCPRETVIARPTMSSHVDAKSPAELLTKAGRVQTRRPQSLRMQALHTAPCTDREGIVLDQTLLNTDGLLLAVDKFLSTGESHHPLLSSSRSID